MQQFSTLDLCQPILDAIAAEGYDTPTPIQEKAIPPALAGHDVLGCAQTGTGKTAAFALPIIHILHSAARPVQRKARGPVLPRALILSPTRELAGQIEASFRTYGRGTKLRQTVIYGGVNQYHQVQALQRGVDILVATPGRLLDLMEQGYVDLSQIRIFVLDEADRMLDMGFIQPIRRIAKEIVSARQTMLFSATMPVSILSLAASLLKNPVNVSVKPAVVTTNLINQQVYMVSHQAKPALMEHLLVEHGVNRGLIFTRTKHGADRLTRRLRHAGVSAASIHGNKSQNQRQQALDSFRSGKSRVLVATDVAARGLDVEGITHVFNYDLPNEPEVYVHRIGRTGRAGATGVAISFCDHGERLQLRAIEQLTSKRLSSQNAPAGINAQVAVAAGSSAMESTESVKIDRRRSPAAAPARTSRRSTRPAARAAGTFKKSGRRRRQRTA